MKRNNLYQVRFHDLRHTNATLMLKHNIPAKVASERLGHSNIGLQRGRLNREVRSSLESSFKMIEGLSLDLFRKRIDRIVWELVGFVSFYAIEGSLMAILMEYSYN